MDSRLEFLLKHYRKNEFPALFSQYEAWKRTRPFAGVRLLDGTPVFRNTLAKYLPLLTGGAELTAAIGPGIPADPEAEKLLKEFGVPLAGAAELQQEYDVVLDCAGALRDTPARRGRVELTRSGTFYYEKSSLPVYVADAGRIKVIETGLGTGDGFCRAMKQLGFSLAGKKLTVFGCGKVGRGIALLSRLAGAAVTVVDDPAKVTPPDGIALIDLHDRTAIDRTLKESFCLVSATGRAGALQGTFDLQTAAASKLIIANMGVEDEFGPELPAERVLCRKKPLNFILEEPTHLKFIDPTMALSNFGAWRVLLGKPLQPGLNLPEFDEEEKILETVRKHGIINEELKQLS